MAYRKFSDRQQKRTPPDPAEPTFAAFAAFAGGQVQTPISDPESRLVYPKTNEIDIIDFFRTRRTKQAQR
jgi:hypothetical protein